MIPKFKPEDKVWAWTVEGKEAPAEVHHIVGLCPGGHVFYWLEDEAGGSGGCCEPFIRPRRDDYQQHEGLGSRRDLDKPLVPDLNEQALEELTEYLTNPRTAWYILP